MYVLTSNLREILISVLCVVMFIDLFKDWGNPSRLTSVMLFIDLGEVYKVPVGSRTSSLDLVTDVNFKSVL